VFEQLLDGLCVDVQAAAQAAAPSYPLSAFANVKDHELQSLPPSQDYLTAPDSALLRSTFPQLLRNFSEAEAVKLLMLGLRESDAMACITHGVMRNSSSLPSQPNPVDQVFRMAAHMSGCFAAPRCLAIQGVYVKSKSLTFPALTKQTRYPPATAHSAAVCLLCNNV
jgi:hypothetical protein